jgi:hypothetical protein
MAPASIAEDQSSVVLDFVSASVAQASVAEDQSSIVLDFVSASMAPTSVVEDSPSVVPGSTSGSTMLHAIAAHSTAAMRAAGPRPGPVRVPLPYSMRSRTLRFTTTLAVAVCSSTRSSAACVRLVARTPPRCSRTAPLAPRLRSCALHSWAHNLLGRQDGTDAVTDRMEPLGRARAGASPPRPLSVLLTRTGGSESVYSRHSALGGPYGELQLFRHLCYHIAITDRCPRIIQGHIARPTAYRFVWAR